jgi:DHA2 family multidrug resistance protein-like MFS transporter
MMADAADGLPGRQRFWAILTVALGVTMAVLDGAIANIALPTIAVDVHASAAASIWVVNAFQLAIIVSLLPLAALGDIVGYRRIYQIGLGVFTLASLSCALSDSLLTLTAARVLQGFGAAGIMSVNAALVRFIYPRNLLGRGLGLNAMIVAVSSALGPTVAAGILALGSWPWLFAVNVPLGLLALAIGWRSLPATPRSPHRFDYASAVLNAVTFGLFIVAIDSFGHGARALEGGLELLGAAVAGALLVRRQLRLPLPLLPVDLLRIPIFGLSIATSVCSFCAQALAYVSLPFYFHDVLGRSQVATGLLMTPWPAVVAVVAPISGRLADRYAAGLLGGLGMAAFCAGLLLLAALPADPSAADVVWRMAICGLGFGLFQSPNNRAMIGAAPKARSGGAAGGLATARLLGQTTGAALVALIFGLAGLHGTTATLVAAAGFAAVAAGVSCLRLGGFARPAPAE